MDAKGLQSEVTVGERNNDGSKYASSGVTLPYNRNKSYQDVNSVSLGKVDAQTARPCAVIGPDRVLPPPISNDTLKKSAFESWCADNVYRHPPEYPQKLTNYHTPIRNISPRQTFQENMQRIMVPPTYSSLKGNEEFTSHMDKNISMSKNSKPNIPIETKYCEVPYTGNSTNNEQKSVRNAELSVSNVNPVLARSAPQAWPTHIRPSRPYGAPELYQYPDYNNCAGPRPVPITRPHRTAHEDLSHGYPDPYCQDIRFKPYTTIKERYPQARYEFIGNYPSPYHPTTVFPQSHISHKYDIQKPLTQPYPYQQVPLKYLDNRLPDPVIDGYQRSTQGNYNFHNQMIHPSYGPIVGNCVQNKFPCPPEAPTKLVAPNKPPFEGNKMYTEYENVRSKSFSVPENYYFNEMQRPPNHIKSQIMPNYSINMHRFPPHPYYTKENSNLKNYEYMPHFRNIDPSMLSQSRIPAQFSPNGITISPSDTNLNLDHTLIQGNVQEDYGYVSQSPTANVRSVDFHRSTNDFYRRYDSRYGPTIRPPPMMAKHNQNLNENSKDKKNIDVRQFLQMWNEVDDENGENATKETVAQFPSDVNKTTNQYETAKNQDQLYVLGLVNVPSEELDKYEHIQKVSKLPENIKGYNSIELLNQFEEVIESSNDLHFKSKSSTSKDVTYQMSMKSSVSHHSLGLLPRPVSPLDVEAKISQSVIHKEVGCNFEIKPCSPKMLNVEAATPIQNLLSERAIEKVSNTLIITSPLLHVDEKNNCNVLNHQDQVKSPNQNLKNSSCKMINTQFNNNDTVRPNYSLQDLESNSGVCLASLPRLDNDIELSFPEVNQQFINANKGESVITATKDLPSLSLEHIENVNSIDSDSSVCQKPDSSYELPTVADSEREFSKLSKYRKIKKFGPESIEKDLVLLPNKQNVRTDSVIIKNPDNPKIFEENKGLHTLETSFICEKDVTNNEKFVDKVEEHYNKLNDTENNCEMDMAIDFSLNKNDNNCSTSSPIDYYMENELTDSSKIHFSEVDSVKNDSETAKSSDLLKDLEKDLIKNLVNETNTETNKLENVSEFLQLNCNSDVINDKRSITAALNFDKSPSLQKSSNKVYEDTDKVICDFKSHEEFYVEKIENDTKNHKLSSTLSVDNIKNEKLTKATHNINIDANTDNDKQLKEKGHSDLPNLTEETSFSINSQKLHMRKSSNENKYELFTVQNDKNNAVATFKHNTDVIHDKFDIRQVLGDDNFENSNCILGVSVTSENENYKNTFNECKENELDKMPVLLDSKQICKGKSTFNQFDTVTLKSSANEEENLKDLMDNRYSELASLNEPLLHISQNIIKDPQHEKASQSDLTLKNIKEITNTKCKTTFENSNQFLNSINYCDKNMPTFPHPNSDVYNDKVNNPKSFQPNIIVEATMISLENNKTSDIVISEKSDENVRSLAKIKSEMKLACETSSSEKIMNNEDNFKSCRLKKELFSPFIQKLVTHCEGPVKPDIDMKSSKNKHAKIRNNCLSSLCVENVEVGQIQIGDVKRAHTKQDNIEVKPIRSCIQLIDVENEIKLNNDEVKRVKQTDVVIEPTKLNNDESIKLSNVDPELIKKGTVEVKLETQNIIETEQNDVEIEQVKHSNIVPKHIEDTEIGLVKQSQAQPEHLNLNVDPEKMKLNDHGPNQIKLSYVKPEQTKLSVFDSELDAERDQIKLGNTEVELVKQGHVRRKQTELSDIDSDLVELVDAEPDQTKLDNTGVELVKQGDVKSEQIKQSDVHTDLMELGDVEPNQTKLGDLKREQIKLSDGDPFLMDNEEPDQIKLGNAEVEPVIHSVVKPEQTNLIDNDPKLVSLSETEPEKIKLDNNTKAELVKQGDLKSEQTKPSGPHTDLIEFGDVETNQTKLGELKGKQTKLSDVDPDLMELDDKEPEDKHTNAEVKLVRQSDVKSEQTNLTDVDPELTKVSEAEPGNNTKAELVNQSDIKAEQSKQIDVEVRQIDLSNDNLEQIKFINTENEMVKQSKVEPVQINLDEIEDEQLEKSDVEPEIQQSNAQIEIVNQSLESEQTKLGEAQVDLVKQIYVQSDRIKLNDNVVKLVKQSEIEPEQIKQSDSEVRSITLGDKACNYDVSHSSNIRNNDITCDMTYKSINERQTNEVVIAKDAIVLEKGDVVKISNSSPDCSIHEDVSLDADLCSEISLKEFNCLNSTDSTDKRHLDHYITVENTLTDVNLEKTDISVPLLNENNSLKYNDIYHSDAEDVEHNNEDTEQVLQRIITSSRVHTECALNVESIHDSSDKYLFQNKYQHLNRPSLKRSLSDSALDSLNDSNDALYSSWRPKRAKKTICNVLQPKIIFESNSQNSRRKSLSSVYNEQNVSFCILIDNNCIINEDEGNEELNEICFTAMSDACLTDLPESVNEYDDIFTPHTAESLKECNQEYSETQEVEGSWVDDVGCMETVVSDDVAEDITISASSSPERIHSSENDEVLLSSEYTDKVKHIYGDKMCNDDVLFLETLYRTPQMNVNKIISRESQIADECSQYYNKDSLEKVLSELNSNEDLGSDAETMEASDANSINPLYDTLMKNNPIEENFDQKFEHTEGSSCDYYFQNNDLFTSLDKTQDGTIHSCESSIDNVFSYSQKDDCTSYTSSTSPEVSSTTSEERNSSILLKITNYKGSRISQINDPEQGTKKSISCKFTELSDYSSTQSFQSNRPLVTKAAQKYIPPLKETLGDFKIRLPLPQHSLLRLKQLKLLKDEPKSNKCNTKSRPDIPKKPKPKFEDVLKSIDEIQFKMLKEKTKKTKKSIPKVVIKKNENGSHYASTTNVKPFNPDLTGRKWQPWVFLEKNHFIDKMSLKNKKKAIFNHRKNTYVLAEKFRKYKSIGNAKFVISQPNLSSSSIGHLKCTIRLKHTY